MCPYVKREEREVDLMYFCLQGLQKRQIFVFLDQWQHGFCLGLEGTRCPPFKKETRISTSKGFRRMENALQLRSRQG